MIIYIPSLAVAFTSVQGFNQKELPEWLYYASVALSLIIGLLAAILLMRTSNSVLTSTSTESTGSNVDRTFLLQLAGIFFIVTALVGLPGILLNLGKVGTVQTDTIFYLGGKLFELGIGLYLLTKPAVWARLLNRLRGRGFRQNHSARQSTQQANKKEHSKHEQIKAAIHPHLIRR